MSRAPKHVPEVVEVVNLVQRRVEHSEASVDESCQEEEYLVVVIPIWRREGEVCRSEDL